VSLWVCPVAKGATPTQPPISWLIKEGSESSGSDRIRWPWPEAHIFRSPSRGLQVALAVAVPASQR
jgi:hypothetical protein